MSSWFLNTKRNESNVRNIKKSLPNKKAKQILYLAIIFLSRYDIQFNDVQNIPTVSKITNKKYGKNVTLL